LKGEVLFAMLTGSASNRAYISTNGLNLSNKVACIKAIRVATGFGLKEAKDFVDGMYQHKEYKLELIGYSQDAKRALKEAGFIVR
jgi:ribosomal protein L7/L12